MALHSLLDTPPNLRVTLPCRGRISHEAPPPSLLLSLSPSKPALTIAANLATTSETATANTTTTTTPAARSATSTDRGSGGSGAPFFCLTPDKEGPTRQERPPE